MALAYKASAYCMEVRMREYRPVNGWAVALVLMVLTLLSSASAAPQYKILHAFGAGNDGSGLWGGLSLDAKGGL